MPIYRYEAYISGQIGTIYCGIGKISRELSFRKKVEFRHKTNIFESSLKLGGGGGTVLPQNLSLNLAGQNSSNILCVCVCVVIPFILNVRLVDVSGLHKRKVT